MNELRKARIAKDLTVIALAKASGVSAATISDIENGLKKSRMLTLNKLANVLEIPVEALEDLAEKPGDRKRNLPNSIAA